MAGPAKVQIDLTADDQASKVIDKVADNVKELDDLDPEIEITTNGERVAAELKQMAQTAEVELDQAAAAADALGQALGPELTAKTDMGKAIGELQRMGLTLDEIRADADQLGDALKKMDAVNLKQIDSGLTGVSTKLDGVRDSGDQSRSVLANMVGNSAQDMGALSGVTGSAGVALGQLAEYATEGGISLKGLAGIAGPLLAVSVVLEKIGKHAQGVAETDAWKTREIDAYAASLREGEDAADALATRLEEAGKIEFHIGDTTFEDVTKPLALAGLSVEQFSQLVVDGEEAWTQWAAGAEKAGVDAGYVQGALLILGEQNKLYTASQEAANYSLEFFGDTADDTATSTGFMSDAFTDLIGEAERVPQPLDSVRNKAEALERAFQRIRGELDMERAILKFEEDFYTAIVNTQNGVALTGDEILGLKEDILDVATYADLNPLEVKALLEQIDQGNIAGVLALTQAALNEKPVGIPTKLLPPKTAGGGGTGSFAPEINMLPPVDGGGTAVVNVHQYIPRGWRGDPLADARRAARRSGGLYQRSRR